MFHRVLFWLSLAGLSWLGLQAVHELGHVLAAWATGGVVTEVDLHPLHISRTAINPNPNPLIVIWGGPLFGALAPLPWWVASRKWLPQLTACFQFFAGFCLISNGAYLGSAIIDPVGDAFDLLREGAPLWQLAAFGLVCVPAGIWLWDGLSLPLGLRKNSPLMSKSTTLGLVAALGVAFAVELAVFQ